jgi:CRP-like cAMP-binding protein
MNLLYKHINSRINLSEDEFKLIFRQFEELKFSKNELIIKSNQMVDFKFFVLKGCLRSYFIDIDGNEHTVQFAIEDWWIGDYPAYFTGKRSTLNVECIEDCTLLKVKKENWEQLYKEIPKLESYARIQLERGLASTHQKNIDSHTMSTKEKYEHFVASFPKLEQRIKNYHIASYLGITPERLSRIRKSIACT